MKYRIIVSGAHCEADRFVAWLNEQGHQAEIGPQNEIVPLDDEWEELLWEELSERDIFGGLWSAYCEDI